MLPNTLHTSPMQEKYDNPEKSTRKLRIQVPQRKIVSLFPLIVAFIIIGIEVVAAFADIIINSVNKTEENGESLVDTKGVLSPSVL